MTERNDDLLVAEYALKLLDETEAAAFKKQLDSDPELREEYLYWSEEFASLYDQVEEVAPPVSLKAKIQDRLFTVNTHPSSVVEVPEKSSWFWPVGLISSLLLVALISFIYPQFQPVSFKPGYMASLETADKSLQVVARYDASRSLLQVSANKASAATGRSHELWLIAGDNPPVSLGTLSTINNENVVLSGALSSVIVGSILAISDEPEGGSPTGSPTGAVLTTAVVTDI